jgi:hypothetical protein
MLIAAISYQGLAHYKSNALVRGVWDRIIRVEEPCSFNQAVEDEYKALKGKRASKKDRAEAEEKEEEDAKGAAKINFRFFTDPAYPTKYPKETEQMETLLKNVIHILYGDQAFFKEFSQARPTIIHDIINALRSLSEELGEKQKITSLKKLSGVSLKNEELEKLWHQLLRKNPISAATQQRIFNLSQEEMQKAGDKLCFEAQLNNYLSNSKVEQIRLYLASRPILLALLNEPSLVDELIQKRLELYKEVKRKNNPMSEKDAAIELKNFAAKFPTLGSFDAIINYNVTKTDPAQYE